MYKNIPAYVISVHNPVVQLYLPYSKNFFFALLMKSFQGNSNGPLAGFEMGKVHF